MWYLDLYTNTAEPLALGAALVPAINILRNFPPLAQTFGELHVLDISGDNNAQSTSLGNTAQLIYFEPGEFETTYPDFGTFDTKPLAYNFDDFFSIGVLP